ncbi:hypothetical protein KUTeg_007690 [Tegillarca granosa]|uniref:Uncharacterized protein n=1 Tax=Tegillarca granosa TaxID=220873 RepID=A0ABQ9FIM4_TEGGR|nr:hypothetical protein KUTeg_007690 [Tegillarca granosa]
MHIRSKFDCGKLYNLCNRGSGHGRCYGGTLHVVEDATPEQLNTRIDTFLEKNINLTPIKIDAIEKAAKLQSQSGLWHTERRKRITASNFGPIINRNPHYQSRN